jgi:hypothetical protein
MLIFESILSCTGHDGRVALRTVCNAGRVWGLREWQPIELKAKAGNELGRDAGIILFPRAASSKQSMRTAYFQVGPERYWSSKVGEDDRST